MIRRDPQALQNLVDVSKDVVGEYECLGNCEALRRRLGQVSLVPCDDGLKGWLDEAANNLGNAGLKTIEDIRKASPSELAEIPFIGTKLAKKIKEQAGGLIKSEEWEELRSTREETEQSLLTEYSNDNHRSD